MDVGEIVRHPRRGLEKTLGLERDHWWAQKALAEMPSLEASP